MNQDYPAEYESRLTLHDGRAVLIRPIVQTDEYLLVDLLNKLSAENGATLVEILLQGKNNE